eukprot:TRINITY_DN10704_c0_g1_i1.p1 TRINITY_DN10704_c0_g1~~TRINITY_DN10704_c0_g1_i1.p1  ORF type:complete len:146 (+),score=21.49 TRINITY_DN10704_c0_g1_i1:22-438(+)
MDKNQIPNLTDDQLYEIYMEIGKERIKRGSRPTLTVYLRVESLIFVCYEMDRTTTVQELKEYVECETFPVGTKRVPGPSACWRYLKDDKDVNPDEPISSFQDEDDPDTATFTVSKPIRKRKLPQSFENQEDHPHKKSK